MEISSFSKRFHMPYDNTALFRTRQIVTHNATKVEIDTTLSTMPQMLRAVALCICASNPFNMHVIFKKNCIQSRTHWSFAHLSELGADTRKWMLRTMSHEGNSRAQCY